MDDVRILYKLLEMVNSLRANSSTREKCACLQCYIKRHPLMLPYIYAVYDPFVQYYLTNDVAIKKGKPKKSRVLLIDALKDPLLDVLNKLSKRRWTGQIAYDIWASCVHIFPEDLHELIGCILNKDLKCRTGIKLVNKSLRAIGRPCIREHEVSLGVLWDGKNVWSDKEDWYASRKLDGVRCNIIVLRENHEKRILAVSRQGKPFDTIDCIIEDFEEYEGPPCIFDGELSLRTKDKKDDFQGLMRQIRRKNHQIKNVMFHAFDWIPLKEDGLLFRDRQSRLKKYVFDLGSRHVCAVSQHRILNKGHFISLRNIAFDKGWEGLILRKDVPHKQGRSKDILKLKKFNDFETEVIGITTGTMNIVEDGREKTIDVMTRAIIRFKGSEVGVGSGWTVEQRRAFFKNPKKIVGKTIKVEYFEETRNKRGGYGLRFPVVKYVWD